MPSTPIKISMRGFAEVAAAATKRKPAAIRKYRFPASEESIGKSNYYVKALSAIKRHHKGDHVYVNNLLQELLAAITTETDSRKRAKYTNNYRAITDYLKKFGGRNLHIQPGKQLYYIYKDVVVSARPDLVAKENGSLVLIKLNLSKDDYSGGVNAMMLHMLYEAAQLRGVLVKSQGVECLQVSSGSRITGPKSDFAHKQILDSACEELLALWPAA